MGNLKEGLAAHTTAAAYSSSGVTFSGCSHSPDVVLFFSLRPLAFPPPVGAEDPSLTKRLYLCQCPDLFVARNQNVFT